MRKYRVKHKDHEANEYPFNGSLLQFIEALWPHGIPADYTVEDVSSATPVVDATPVVEEPTPEEPTPEKVSKPRSKK